MAITTPESSMALGGAIAVLAVAQIVTTIFDRRQDQMLWNTMGLSGLILLGGLVLIGIGVRDHYGQPLQRLWPLSTFWPQAE
jgi:hypothetical protein